ncbi:unnamed protein product [Closterium sp. NIES-64]|nr:unnamed protein product [Closterium sp. NIES-64]
MDRTTGREIDQLTHKFGPLFSSPIMCAPVAAPCGGTCKANQQCMNGVCKCKEGYTEMDGACTVELKKGVIKGNRECVQGACTCKEGYTEMDGACTGELKKKGLEVAHGSNVPVADPYGGTCGETRECVQGVFECKAGYTEIDGACTVADPCDGIVCEGDREYVPTNGQGVCECMAGYTEIDGVCTDVPPNVPLAPLIPPTRPVTAVCSPACSLYASCQVANGTAVCECDAGYTMLDNGECTPACSPPCSAETTCQVENGIGVCQCNAGYTLLSNSQCKGECQGRAFSLFPSLMSSAGSSKP